MIYKITSKRRPDDFYFFDLNNNTWSGWFQGKRFKDLTKYPYTRQCVYNYNQTEEHFLKFINKDIVKEVIPLGSTIEDVKHSFPEYFI